MARKTGRIAEIRAELAAEERSIAAGMQFIPHYVDRKDRPGPGLLIGLDTLEAILYRENSILAAEDVPALIGVLLDWARRTPYVDKVAIDRARARYRNQARKARRERGD